MEAASSPFRGLVETTSKQIGKSNRKLPHEFSWIQRAKAQGEFCALDSNIVVAEAGLHTPAGAPRIRQVAVEIQREIDVAVAGVEIAGDIGKSVPSARQRSGVILPQGDGFSSHVSGVSRLLRAIHHPAVRLA